MSSAALRLDRSTSGRPASATTHARGRSTALAPRHDLRRPRRRSDSMYRRFHGPQRQRIECRLQRTPRPRRRFDGPLDQLPLEIMGHQAGASWSYACSRITIVGSAGRTGAVIHGSQLRLKRCHRAARGSRASLRGVNSLGQAQRIVVGMRSSDHMPISKSLPFCVIGSLSNWFWDRYAILSSMGTASQWTTPWMALSKRMTDRAGRVSLGPLSPGRFTIAA